MSANRVAAIQLTSNHILSENLEKVSYWVEEAAKAKASLVVLPENVAIMGKAESDKLKIAEKYGNGPIQELFGKLSNKYKIWLLGGTIPILSNMDQKVTASALLFNPKGECVARYDKIHLFDVIVEPGKEIHQESKTIAPGHDIVSVATSIGNLGLSVCYDLRFPELYRKLFNLGSEVFLIPSAFTAITGRAHWEVLLRARAIENFSYVVAAAQTGTHSNGRQTYGHSMIIDPWGKILDIIPAGEGMVLADIDLEYLKDIRTRIPVFMHQRKDIL